MRFELVKKLIKHMLYSYVRLYSLFTSHGPSSANCSKMVLISLIFLWIFSSDFSVLSTNTNGGKYSVSFYSNSGDLECERSMLFFAISSIDIEK